MKLNRKLMLILAVVLSVAMAAGGTLAYLQDTDEDVNVMTLGNVYINQLEYERVPTEGHELTNDEWVSTGETDKYGYTPDEVRPFTQSKPLYPAVFADGEIKWDERAESKHQQSWADVKGEKTTGAPGSFQLFDNSVKNVIDKFVFVENTGNSDAYVRTWIALEQGSVKADNFKKVIMTNTDKAHWDWETVATDVEIADTNNVTSTYCVLLATYKGPTSNPTGILAPGAISYVSLAQVYMRPEATNDDVIAIDGNQNGTYDILVFSQAVQAEGFTDAETALNEAFGGVENIDLTDENNPIPWKLTKLADNRPDFEAALNDTEHWDGKVDTSWYNDTDTEFVLTTAEQLAGLAKLVDDGNTFEGKTIKLGNDICLGCTTGECANSDEGEPLPFDPIGSYRNDKPFKGTFDGQNYMIENLSQNTWELNNGYSYGDLGLGLFGLVEDATIKNLVMDCASISGESAICGTVAACAYGDMVFENITVKNSKVNDYQYYAGGIVGWASGDHQYINCVVDETTVVGSQWGDFGNANGGLIGGIGKSGTYHIKDCTVAPRIDATNDVVSAYQWYNYRNSGMLIGRVPVTITNGDVTTVPVPENVTCENVTVIYGDWANYHYCEFAGTGYPYVRAEAGVSVEAYSNVRYGHPTDANGNTVVDDNHVHNEGEAHMKLVAFDQLFGGPADHRYCYYGLATHDGVTVVYNNK